MKCSRGPGRQWLATVRGRVLLVASIAVWTVSQSTAPVEADEQALFQFDIPQQSLASALDRYGAITGTVGLYRGELATGRMSKPVTGRYTSENALTLLLRDTGLAARYASVDAFTLVLSRDDARSAGSAASIARAAIAQQDTVQRDYSALLQERVNAALCVRSVTRPANYRIALSFRVGPAGDIEQFNLLGSSGDIRRDDAITDALRTLPIGRAAPSHMSQPFTMVVLPQSSGGAIDCPAIRSALRHG